MLRCSRGKHTPAASACALKGRFFFISGSGENRVTSRSFLFWIIRIVSKQAQPAWCNSPEGCRPFLHPSGTWPGFRENGPCLGTAVLTWTNKDEKRLGEREEQYLALVHSHVHVLVLALCILTRGILTVVQCRTKTDTSHNSTALHLANDTRHCVDFQEFLGHGLMSSNKLLPFTIFLLPDARAVEW